MDLRFHLSNFCYRFHEMISEIANLGVLASRFLTLSTFAASVSSLFLGQFFMFVLEDGFFFFGYKVVELGIVLSRTNPCAMWMHVCVFIHRLGLNARIHINAFDFSFLFIFLDRGRSPGFFVLARE